MGISHIGATKFLDKEQHTRWHFEFEVAVNFEKHETSSLGGVSNIPLDYHSLGYMPCFIIEYAPERGLGGRRIFDLIFLPDSTVV